MEQQCDKIQKLEFQLNGLKEKQLDEEARSQEKLQNITETVGKREKSLLEKVQFFANQLEEYRFDSQKALFAAQESSKTKELQFKEEIRTLKERVEQLDWENKQSREKTRTLRYERDALNKELKKLKRQYTSDISELETNYAKEQTKVKELKRVYQEIREEAERDTMRRVKEVEAKSSEEQTRLRTECTLQIAEIERHLKDMEGELSDKSDRIDQLEAERMSLRMLLSRSWVVVSKMSRKGVTRFLRKKSRSFTYLS